MALHELYELARRQGGVYARWQALQLGLSHYAIARRLETKEWVIVIPGVLTSATSALGPSSREWAADLACGPNSLLSGPSALHRHRLDVGPLDSHTQWVTIPPERHVRISAVRTIREAVDPSDVVILDELAKQDPTLRSGFPENSEN